MKIHAIQTGTVALTTAWREGVGHGRRRLLNTLLDREWTDPLPIYAFAIEHPEGVIVVDTGETARVAEPGYLPRWSPFFRFAVRESVRPEQEIGPQLERLGIEPSAVRQVVMTHMHTDHAGAYSTSRTTRSWSQAPSSITRRAFGDACAATSTSPGPSGSTPPQSTCRTSRSVRFPPASR